MNETVIEGLKNKLLFFYSFCTPFFIQGTILYENFIKIQSVKKLSNTKLFIILLCKIFISISNIYTHTHIHMHMRIYLYTPIIKRQTLYQEHEHKWQIDISVTNFTLEILTVNEPIGYRATRHYNMTQLLFSLKRDRLI